MIKIDGQTLSLRQLVEVARNKAPVQLSKIGREKLNQANTWLQQLVDQQTPVYGINTGLGIFSDRKIQPTDSEKLSRKLILSHSVGLGSSLSDEIVRAAMLVRANALTAGHSGIRVEIVELLLEMLNRNIVPEIPSQGSLGSSGDLCMLSQLALVFTTDENDVEEQSGWAVFDNKRLTGKAAMKAAGLTRFILGPKEGLALSNGASFCAALAALVVEDALDLIDAAIGAMALSTEAVCGCSAAFDSRLNAARNQTGQQAIANAVQKMLDGSSLIDSSSRVQDAYSIRCTPQVLGPVLELLQFIQPQIEREINAATDNPLLFEDNVCLSGGNFHGEIIGMAMDFASIALAEMGAISERRIYRLLESATSAGLPAMLVDKPEDAGLNSGYMMPHYTAAALVMENQTLAHPDSVHSLPTSAGQEDHNANAWVATVHAKKILENVRNIIAIELFCATRAVELRLKLNPELHLGMGTQQVYEQMRTLLPAIEGGDQWWQPEILRIIKHLHDDTLKFPGILRV